NSTYAQTVTVTGRVTESSGNPLPGVTIVIRGTSPTGTTTGDDGRYTLAGVPSDGVLSFSFVGFKTQEIPVNGRTRLDVQLQEDITTLSEVIVNAGYYTVKDQLRTGSIARVTAKEIENQPVSNALSAVQGRIAGVNITQGGGTAGGGYEVQIRGMNSLRREGNYPMYIIDGVPVSSETISNSLSAAILPYTEINPLNTIHPNDIESIEILKDADATAIYGSRGANGVILVTTKKGRAGRKTALSVSSSYGLSRVARKLEMMDTPQYLEMRRQAYANDGITEYPANAYDINGTWDQARYTDWQDELIGGTAVNSSVQLSISGGSDNTGFLVSGSHNEQTTVFGKDFRYKTNNLSMNLNHRSDDNRFTFNTSGLFSEQSNNLIRSDITNQSLVLSPNAPALYKDDGSLNWENSTFTNPVAAYESTYSNKGRTFNVNLNMGYELFRSFYLKLNGGIDQQVFEERTLSPSTIYNPAFGRTPSSSFITKANQQRFSYLLEPQVNYKHKFNEHEIDILAGGTFQHRQTSSLAVFGYGFESNALITNLAAAGNITVNYDTRTEYKYAAVFGRMNYQYKSRYILNLTGRRDGSSRFGTNNRFANFGAAGAAWLFAEEAFLNDIRWLSFGKLRASYGVTGSDAIGDYQYLDTYTVGSQSYGGIKSLNPSRLFNPYFSWEKTTKLEVALELGFLDDRIRLNSAWFRNRSGNQLVGIPLPGTTGFASIQANLPATVENKGLELELNTNPVRIGSFNWNSDFNITFPRNKLVSFPGLEGSTYANQYVIGYPTSIVKVYNYEGIDPETGLYTFTDYNNDGNISSPDDNQVIKKIGARYYGGWSNQLSYKQWEFSFLFQFVNQVQENFNSMMTRPGSVNNQPVEVLDVWSPENPDGRYMPYSSGAYAQKNQSHLRFMDSSAGIGDASFIRLKNIQLSYRLPVNRHIQDVRFHVQGQNLLTFTDYFGVDPEFILTRFLPPLKTWSFGVQFNF
ncbi:SusC/RagA family TonB-linked outer membrane protein, partial [uncultured Proteiniphilum sp.]|uniref:SusC/RagA family TonB-linked outer membrane protein n=1 Tax=uncultured Proteiniphilum sp. TaxID=497637 RepID=UPI0026289559